MPELKFKQGATDFYSGPFITDIETIPLDEGTLYYDRTTNNLFIDADEGIVYSDIDGENKSISRRMLTSQAVIIPIGIYNQIEDEAHGYKYPIYYTYNGERAYNFNDFYYALAPSINRKPIIFTLGDGPSQCDIFSNYDLNTKLYYAEAQQGEGISERMYLDLDNNCCYQSYYYNGEPINIISNPESGLDKPIIKETRYLSLAGLILDRSLGVLYQKEIKNEFSTEDISSLTPYVYIYPGQNKIVYALVNYNDSSAQIPFDTINLYSNVEWIEF